VDPKTYSTWIWRVIEVLNVHIHMIDINDRFIFGNKICNMIIDATDCPIQRSSNKQIQRIYYSGYKKRHLVKYEVGVQIDAGFFVWIAGPAPGSVPDIELTRRSGLLQQLLPGEYYLADKAYQGENLSWTPIKKPHGDEWKYNSALSSIRETVEHANARLKFLNIFVYPFRQDVELHPKCFFLCCNLINIDLVYHPLHRIIR